VQGESDVERSKCAGTHSATESRWLHCLSSTSLFHVVSEIDRADPLFGDNLHKFTHCVSERSRQRHTNRHNGGECKPGPLIPAIYPRDGRTLRVKVAPPTRKRVLISWNPFFISAMPSSSGMLGRHNLSKSTQGKPNRE
jgi:hypothetical protein